MTRVDGIGGQHDCFLATSIDAVAGTAKKQQRYSSFVSSVFIGVKNALLHVIDGIFLSCHFGFFDSHDTKAVLFYCFKMNVNCVFQTYNDFTYNNSFLSLFHLTAETSDDNG